MSEPDDDRSYEELAASVDDGYDSMVKENAELYQDARSSAKAMYELAAKYDEMADHAREIGTLHLVMARVSAGALADLLKGEFNLTVDEEECIDEEGLDDDGDGDTRLSDKDGS